MARSYNKVTLLGNLGQDPELRTTPSGQTVCTLNLATSERYKDKNGEWQETTEWHRIILWERLAEIANQYLKKGRKVLIEGRIKYRNYEKDGVTRWVTEIWGRDLILLDSREQSGDTVRDEPASNYTATSSMESHVPDSYDDDEVPF